MRVATDFMTKFRGVPAPVLARALNKLMPGVNWAGCSKAHMADQWVRCHHKRFTTMELHDITRVLPVPETRLTAEEREAGCEKFFLNVRPHPLDGWWACHNNWVAGRLRSRAAAIEEAIAACEKNPQWLNIALAGQG